MDQTPTADLDHISTLDKAILACGQANDMAQPQNLARRARAYADRWGLILDDVASGGQQSCCIYARDHAGQEVVLKIPGNPRAGRLEHAALSLWSTANASPQVLERAGASGVYVASRVRPGDEATPTGSPADSEAFCDLLERMVRATQDSGRLPMHPFDLTDITRSRIETNLIFRPDYAWVFSHIPFAESLFRMLIETTVHPRLLHGDLQPKNILVADTGLWQTIDPLTCTGDINAEAALWAVCQKDGSLIEDRIRQLSAHCSMLHEGRLRAWCFVLGVAEYRLYRPLIAQRIEAFVRSQDAGRLRADAYAAAP